MSTFIKMNKRWAKQMSTLFIDEQIRWAQSFRWASQMSIFFSDEHPRGAPFFQMSKFGWAPFIFGWALFILRWALVATVRPTRPPVPSVTMKVASRPKNPEVWVKKQLTDIPVIRLFFRIPFLSDFPIFWISVFPILQFSDVSNFQISDLPNYRNTEFLDFRISKFQSTYRCCQYVQD